MYLSRLSLRTYHSKILQLHKLHNVIILQAHNVMLVHYSNSKMGKVLKLIGVFEQSLSFRMSITLTKRSSHCTMLPKNDDEQEILYPNTQNVRLSYGMGPETPSIKLYKTQTIFLC